MLSIVSIGISKYKYDEKYDIECATNDADRVYNTFENVCSKSFSHFRSVCLHDLNSDNFNKLLELLNQE